MNRRSDPPRQFADTHWQGPRATPEQVERALRLLPRLERAAGSKADLARRLGITRASLAQYDRGRSRPSALVCSRIFALARKNLKPRRASDCATQNGTNRDRKFTK